MKQIPFYQGIEKKLIVTGPAIREGQTYKCVVYSSLSDKTTAISAIAVGEKAPKPECEQGCQHDMYSVEFHFTEFQTAKLKLGDNSVAVYDTRKQSSDSDYTLYKVYEARAYTSDSVVNQEAQNQTALTFVDVDSTNHTGWLKGGRMVDGYIVLKNETFDANGYLNLV